uniref:Reverse transcriptase domain-containing protein n=1 Tax=Meloidogyne incognita TaxID=6306 RepID=A0A914N8H4_MELIC
MDDFTFALENKNSVDIIYFDLAKAFDTVPHSLLISKLYKVGIQGNLLSWINDYLTNRTFTVRVSNQYSEEKHCTSGVPQGSILDFHK